MMTSRKRSAHAAHSRVQISFQAIGWFRRCAKKNFLLNIQHFGFLVKKLFSQYAMPYLLVEMPASAGMTPATVSFRRMPESPLMPVQVFNPPVSEVLPQYQRPKLANRSLRFSLFLIINLALQAATFGFEDQTIGAYPLSLGGAFAAAKGHAECIYINPAGVSGTNGFAANLSYARLFGLADLGYGSAAAIIPLGSFGVAAAVYSFGNEKYRENIFYLCGSAALFKNVSLGVNCRYGSVNITGYGQAGTFILDAGVLTALSESVSWGFVAKNVDYAKIGQAGEELPQILQTGLSANPVSSVTLLMDLYKDARFPLEFRSGIDYRLFPQFNLRVGFSSQPSHIGAGFGINLPVFCLDYAFNTHSELGASHQFSIGLCLNKQKGVK